MEPTEQKTPELSVVVLESGLNETEGRTLLQQFENFFSEADKWIAQAKTLSVTTVEDKEGMRLAKELRIELKNIRVSVEKRRKELKERIVREGKAIDGMANIIKAQIEPIEEYLESQEKFAEILEQKEREAKYQSRLSELSKYVPDANVYNLNALSDEDFTKLIERSRKHFEIEQAELKKAEEERIAKEKAEQEERERVQKENEELKKKQEEHEAILKAEREKAENERKELEAQKEKELALERAKAAEEKRIADEARLKAERELAEKKAAEEKAEKERLEALRQKELAPDKEKLFSFSEDIRNVAIPRGMSEEAQKIANSIESKLILLSEEIKKEIAKL